MSELETEHTYQLRQAEAAQAEKLKEVHEGYCAAIEELKEKNEVSVNYVYFLLSFTYTLITYISRHRRWYVLFSK